MQRWKKLGLLYQPDHDRPQLAHSALAPFAHSTGDGEWDIYFSGRDDQDRSRGWRLRMHADGPDSFRVDGLDTEPVLDLGEPGQFDDSGVVPTCLIERDGAHFLYFNGWTLGDPIPFYSFCGVAKSTDGGRTFQKLATTPNVLDRNEVDPISTFSTFILHDADTNIWRMWYVSCLRWAEHAGELRHDYHIRYAESADGVSWKREGRVAIDFAHPGEYAIARPVVIRESGRYAMYYSYRDAPGSTGYRIGYAESADSLNWTRMDNEVGLDTSPGEWDSDMLCYAWPFDHAGRRYMLYNGNGYGRSGFGVAMLENP